ncbi:MAG TPA: hypothetical protein PKD91_01970 [Bacteroidia bacterium]|nr:hypothetical protein [Bacteroidia bacterium]
MESKKSLEFTRPQAVSAMYNALKEIDISGRATGKSSKIGWRMHKLVTGMPQSATVISGATYAQLLSITMAPVLDFLSSIGYHRGSHYVIGKPPSNWKLPYQPPLDFSRSIIFKNGSGFNLSSQDREGMNRGRNIDHIIGDEMLTQNKVKFENEVVASNRGNLGRFKDSSLHHGMSLTSSMPLGLEGQWLLDYSKYYEEDGYPIWDIWNRLCDLQLQFIDSRNYNERKELIKEMAEVRKQIRFYKSPEGVLFTIYNVFENLKNVGMDYILQMRTQMSDLAFCIEILNKRITAVLNGFYKINDSVHTYTKYDYSYIDNLDFDPEKLKVHDSRRDGDVLKNRPLDIAIDYGAVINGLVVGQETTQQEFRYLKSLYVKHPKGLQNLIDDFATYYQHHKDKRVNHWYDQTATGRDAVRLKYVDETEAMLKKKGWTVIRKYIGAAPGHQQKFELWDKLLTGKDPRMPVVMFNKDNFKDALVSMKMANVKQGSKGFEKDKSSERSKVIPREQATDLSDAADMIVWGRYAKRMSSNYSFFDMRTA